MLIPDHCMRCGAPLQASTMSFFNCDTICMDCKTDERLAPGYEAAHEAEIEAVQRGDYNFPGVGLSKADADFLAARRAQRANTTEER